VVTVVHIYIYTKLRLTVKEATALWHYTNLYIVDDDDVSIIMHQPLGAANVT